MISRTTKQFWKYFSALSRLIQLQTLSAYHRWKYNPYHKSLFFKEINSKEGIYSVRINLAYRALGYREENIVFWFWIGSHEDYEKLLARL